MTDIENQVKSLTLEFFSKINAVVIEKNGLFDISLPDNYSKMFQKNYLHIIFDDAVLHSDNYELVSPGSNILLKILNECINFGPISSAKINSNNKNLKIIRFYFYIIFESIISKTRLIHVDVDINSKKITMIDDFELDFNDSLLDFQIDSETMDDCYVESITYLEQNLFKSEISDFKNYIFNLKEEELENISLEYKKRNKEIQDKFIILRSKGESGISLEKLIDENDATHNEEIHIRKNLDIKYSIVLDFALIGAMLIR